MKINKDLILKVAKNARLNLTESEVDEFLPQFKEILDTFSKISEINVKHIKASFQPIEIKNAVREDKIETCLTQEEALKNTQHKSNGYFKGPKVI